MKRPSFQFYPADWRSNLKLRRCSKAARGVWIDALCVLHDSDEYGVARFPLRELADAVGTTIMPLRELAEKGVLKGSDGTHEAYIFTPTHARKAGPPVTLIEAGPGPCWYSSRMVRDEYIRSKAGESTRFGHTIPREGEAPDPPPNHSPPRRLGDGSSSSSASASALRFSEPIERECPSLPETAAPDAPSKPNGINGKHTQKATRLPEDWYLPDDWRDWAVNVHKLDPQHAVRLSLDFRDYWHALPGAKARKLDWKATWRRWVRKDCGDA